MLSWYREWMRYVAILILLLSASGCAGEPDVYAVIQDRTYTPSEFRFASQHKDFPTVIAGNPFPQTTRQVHDNVLLAMQPVNWWFSEAFTPRTRFTDTPSDGPSPYRVNVLLNPKNDTDPTRYCTKLSAADAIGVNSGKVSARMAFCRDGTLLSTSRGVVEKVEDSTDPRFRRMITRMTMALFPQRRDNDLDCGPATRRRSC